MAACEELEELSDIICGNDSGGFDEAWVAARSDVSAFALSATVGLETTVGTITMVSGKKYVYIAAVEDTIQYTGTINKGKGVYNVNWTIPGIAATSNQHWLAINKILNCDCGLTVLLRKRGILDDESDDQWFVLSSDISPTSAGIFGGLGKLVNGESVSDSKLVATDKATTTIALTRTASTKGQLRKVSLTTAALRAANVI